VTTTSTAGRTCSQPASPGTKNNQLAIGMRVKVIARGMAQSDEVHSGGSYLSQNELRLHFALSTPPKSIASIFAGPLENWTHSRIFPSTSSIPFHSIPLWKGPASFRLKVSAPILRLSPNSQQAPQSLSQLARGPSVAANLPCNESCASPLFPKELRYPPRGHLR